MRFEERVSSMIHYVTQNTHCRSQVLLAYFGQEQSYNCKQCDVCRPKRNQTVTIAQKITQLLSKQPLSTNQLLDHFPNNRVEATETIRQMLDRKEIIQNQYLLQIP
jgi:ATP-dependent DNA helicase RecQ